MKSAAWMKRLKIECWELIKWNKIPKIEHESALPSLAFEATVLSEKLENCPPLLSGKVKAHIQQSR